MPGARRGKLQWHVEGRVDAAELAVLNDRRRRGGPTDDLLPLTRTVDRHVTAELGDGWSVRAWLERPETGGIRISRIEVFPEREPSASTTARMLKRLRLGWLADEIEDDLRDPRMPQTRALQGWYDDFVVRVRPGRAGRDDLQYARWALRYVQALRADPRAPLKRLLETYEGEEYVSETSLRAILNKARRRGLLTKAEPGRAGGELTTKAKRLLRDAGLEG